MLKQLIVNNLILIDSLKISFQEGFNAITGETGAGKSAVMSALKLLTGAREGGKIVRRGALKATVEALFDLTKLGGVKELLEEAGIDCESSDELIIKREIALSGKGRIYINHQMAQLSLLKRVGERLVEIVGQHASRRLYSEEEHRNILDLYGGCLSSREKFSAAFLDLQRTEKRLLDMQRSEALRSCEIERLKCEIEEIAKCAVKEGEEEELFSEYSLLTHAEEIIAGARALLSTLHRDEKAAVATLHRAASSLKQLTALDSSLSPLHDALQNAACEVEEVAYSLKSYMGDINSDKERLEVIGDRLSAIDRVKRKYGPSIGELLRYREEAELLLQKHENADSEIEELRGHIASLKQECRSLAEALTAKRAAAAGRLEREMTEELRELNMPKVEFKVTLTGEKRSSNGDERVAFLIAPNVGESTIPIAECASGGELSRLLLALQKLLSSKRAVTTIVFDEIDANIGGETAVVVGKKLSEIGRNHQVMCITHFPQVARQAEHHYMIEKVERGGRTLSTISRLDKRGKKREIARMLGEPAAAEKRQNSEELACSQPH